VVIDGISIGCRWGTVFHRGGAQDRGERRARTFDRKKDADAYHSRVNVEVEQGVHTADSVSVTVAEAAALWLTTCKERGLEKATTETYAAHVNLHIQPIIGRVKLSRLTAPMVRDLEDKLRTKGRSAAITRKIMTSLCGTSGPGAGPVPPIVPLAVRRAA
jgi:integrase